MTESQKFTLTITFAELARFADESGDWGYSWEELTVYYWNALCAPYADWLSVEVDYDKEKVHIEYVDL